MFGAGERPTVAGLAIDAARRVEYHRQGQGERGLFQETQHDCCSTASTTYYVFCEQRWINE